MKLLIIRLSRTRARADAQRRKQERMATRLQEVFSAVPVVQAFGREAHEHQRFQAENDADVEDAVHAARFDSLSARAVELIGAAATVIVVGVGAWEVLAGRLSVGAILVFTSYLHGLYRPMRNLAKLLGRLARASVSAQRISRVLETAPDVDDAPDAREVDRLEGAITFERVSFEYEPGRPVLRDVSFHVAPGQRVAIVFEEKDRLLLFTEGRNSKRNEYKSNGKRFFPIEKVILLIDENSASASEIIAGAIQDWDRGIIVRRRSYGKGLVQEQYDLNNGGAIRLTVARYFTPSGRSIQRDYTERGKYDEDINDRYHHGDLFHKDSSIVKNGGKYYTQLLKREVSGSGGITLTNL